MPCVDMVPALPDPAVDTDTLAPSLRVRVGETMETVPAFPVLDAVLKSPAPEPVSDTLEAASKMAPPAPPPVVLLSIALPPDMLSVPTLVVIVPAFPVPVVVDADIFPLAPKVKVEDVTLIVPAFPVFDAVLNSPPPAPLIETLDEFTAIAPPAPLAFVLLTIWPPFSAMLAAFAVTVPAAPAAVVSTEILLPSLTVSDGVDIIT